MRRNRLTRRLLTAAALSTTGGITLLWLPSCEAVLTTVNPCGNIFDFCDANDLTLAFSDIPDFDVDPTCTVPFLQGCSQGNIYPYGNGP